MRTRRTLAAGAMAAAIGLIVGCGGGAETPEEAVEQFTAAWAAEDPGGACEYAVDTIAPEDEISCEEFVEDPGYPLEGTTFEDIEIAEIVDADDEDTTVVVVSDGETYEFLTVNDGGWKVDFINATADDIF